ncbi:MAG: imidazole glycerol phosphate synthase subunit HisH [bacterium]
MIVIIDYGMGNLRSVYKAFKRLNIEATVSSATNDIKNAQKLILPGVGHFKNGMENLNKLGLIELLHTKVIEEKTPILGICLGMQLFTNHSQEGDVRGLGWINAETIKFNFNDLNNKLKIPHMGWNSINIQKESRIMSGLNNSSSFYFVHSYYVNCNDKNDILCKTNYGIEYTSAVEKNNITGMQFHPEKSHDEGLQIINNFAKDF